MVLSAAESSSPLPPSGRLGDYKMAVLSFAALFGLFYSSLLLPYISKARRRLAETLFSRSPSDWWHKMGFQLPWQYDETTIDTAVARYKGKYTYEAVKTNYDDFYFSSYKVACIATFTMYGCFVLLVAINILINNLPRSVMPRAVRAHLLEAPLAKRRHHTPLGSKFWQLRLPLRVQSIIITGLFLCQVIPLFAFYRVPSPKVIYPSALLYRLRYVGDRTALLSTGLLPLVILTAGRRPLASVSGLVFGDLMVYHRWLARLLFLQVNIHAFVWTGQMVERKRYASRFLEAYWNWGIVAFTFFWCLTILSMKFLREKNYEVFVFFHVFFAVIGLLGVWLHIHLLHDDEQYRLLIILTEMSAAFWALDRVIRWANRAWLSWQLPRNKVTTASVVNHGSIFRLRVKIPAGRVADATQAVAHGWSSAGKLKAGMAISLLVPRLQAFSDHPFTVIDAGHLQEDRQDVDTTKSGFVDLLIRPHKGLTKLLNEYALSTREQASLEAAVDSPRPLMVFLEGPYGHSHFEQISRHDAVLAFAGGEGIAFSLPYFVYAALHTQSRCKLVWAMREVDLLSGVEDQLVRLADALEQAEPKRAGYHVPIVEIYLTGKSTSATSSRTSMPILERATTAVMASAGVGQVSGRPPSPGTPASTSESAVDKKRASNGSFIESLAGRLAPAIQLTVRRGGRPSLDVAAHLGTPSGSQSGTQTATVLACGSSSLCDDARQGALSALKAGEWRDVEYIEECFSW